MSNLRMKLMGKRLRLSSDSKSLSSRSEDFDDFSSGRSYRQTSNSSAVLSLEDLEQTTRRISEDTNSFFTLQIERRSSPSDIGSEHASIRNSPASIAPNVDEEDYRRRASAVSANPSFGYDQYYQEHLDALTDYEDEDVFFTANLVTMRLFSATEAEQEIPVLEEGFVISLPPSNKDHIRSDPLGVIAEDYGAELDIEKEYACNEDFPDSRIISPHQGEGEASRIWKLQGAPNSNDTSLSLSHSEASKGHLESLSHVFVSSGTNVVKEDDMGPDVPRSGTWKLGSQFDDKDKLVCQPPSSPSGNSKFAFFSSPLGRKLDHVLPFTKATDRLRFSRPATHIRDVLSTYNGALFHGKSRVSTRMDDSQTLALDSEGEGRQAGKCTEESGSWSPISSDKISSIMGQSANSLLDSEITETRDTGDDIMKARKTGLCQDVYSLMIAPNQQTKDNRIVHMLDSPFSSISTLETYDFGRCPSTTNFFGDDLKFGNPVAVAYDSASIKSIATDLSGWRDNTPRIKANSGASWLMPGDSDHHTFHQAMLDSQTQRDEQLGDLDTRFGRQGHYLKDVMKEDSWSDNGLPSDLASLRHLIV